MATKKKKVPVKKKVAPKKAPKPLEKTQKQRDEEYLLILITATERYMKHEDDVMGQQSKRLKKQLEELRASK